MKSVFVTALFALGLFAQETDLRSLLDAAVRSDAAQMQLYDARARMLQQRGALLPGGVSVYAQAGYAEARDTPDNAVEYHVSVEKPFRTASTATIENLLGAGSELAVRLGRARLQNAVYGAYVDACTLQEELWLIEDAHSRGTAMEQLIRTGMEGGEFDRSAWLRSRLNVQTLTLRIDELKSRSAETLQRLGAATQTDITSLRCSDLSDTITLPPQQTLADAPLLLQLENRAAGADAMKAYRDTWLQEITVGAEYDDEMDVRRGIVFASIPLGFGSRIENDRESARLSALAAAAELRTMRRDLAARIAAFTSAQQTRKTNLQRLNDELIPEAYETTVLLQERFMGSEASYLEYIDSQKALFALLMEGVQLRASALKAEAELFAELGIAPHLQKDKL